MDFVKYIGLLINRAAQKSVLLTDRLTILIVPFATLALWISGATMTDSIQETLLLGVAITVIAVVVLRLVAASYFVWKEDQEAKAQLTAEIERPERNSELMMKDYAVGLRKQLSAALGRLAAFATFPPYVTEGTKGQAELVDLTTEIDTLINQLSYDFPVRIAALKFRDYCLDLLHKRGSPGSHFWEQRKLTFRLLHKEDSIADLITLVELEILLEDAGLGSQNDDGIIGEIKSAIRALGPDFHREDIQNDIRDAMRGQGKVSRSALRKLQSRKDTESETLQ